MKSNNEILDIFCKEQCSHCGKISFKKELILIYYNQKTLCRVYRCKECCDYLIRSHPVNQRF